MSNKSKQVIGPITVLIINTTLVLLFLFKSFSIFSLANSDILSPTLLFLLIDSALCLKFQFNNQKKNNKNFYIWFISLGEVLITILKLFIIPLNIWVSLYSLIIFYILFSMYISFRKRKQVKLPYILFMILVLLPIFLYFVVFSYFYFVLFTH